MNPKDQNKSPTADVKTLSETEEQLQAHFDATAPVPSEVDLTRMKARAEAIPASSGPGLAWLRPALLLGAFALITFAFLHRGQQSERTDSIAQAPAVPSTESSSWVADVSESMAAQPSIQLGQRDAESLEPFLEIGWDDDYDLDMLHGSYDEGEYALILEVYESL
jgi:hypothetical protein